MVSSDNVNEIHAVLFHISQTIDWTEALKPKIESERFKTEVDCLNCDTDVDFTRVEIFGKLVKN